MSAFSRNSAKREGVFKTILKAQDGKFDIISSDLYVDGSEELSLNNIEGAGQFLIIKSDNPNLDSASKL